MNIFFLIHFIVVSLYTQNDYCSYHTILVLLSYSDGLTRAYHEMVCGLISLILQLHIANFADSSIADWQSVVCNVLMPSIKRKLLPPREFEQTVMAKQILDLHQLYKVFERC